MVYLIQKYKNIIYLILLVLVLGTWFIFSSKNIDAVPEKADLVLLFLNIAENI